MVYCILKVGYILSLGVASTYRKQGIASLLLDQLISYLNTNYCNQVKALYLHVLTTNTQAIRFYEHRSLHWRLQLTRWIILNLFQGISSAFIPTLLLRYKGEEKGRLHSRPLLKRRSPHLGRPGLRQARRHGAVHPLTSQVRPRPVKYFLSELFSDSWWESAANWTLLGWEPCPNWGELHTVVKLCFPDDNRNVLLSIIGLSVTL